MKICSELEVFLKENLSLEYEKSKCECGQVILKNYYELIEEKIEVELEEDHYSSIEQLKKGPFGHYEIISVNLIKSCENYFPDHILLWLPYESLFGTYDSDHSKLLIFENVKWSDIVKSPLQYINSQWHDDEHQTGKPYDPREKYKVIYEN